MSRLNTDHLRREHPRSKAMSNLLSNAECGPSNALSSFSKHSQQDRTLQQDRWIPGAARPPDTFRSPELNRGAEQAAFQRDAQQFFEKGRPLQLPLHESFQRTSLPPQHRQEDWHQQFQRVNISSPPPSQFLSQTQLGKQPDMSISAPWHDEFSQFNAPPQQLSYQPQVQQRLASMAYTTAPQFDQIPQFEQTTQQTLNDPKFEDEAFELAFAEAENAVQSPSIVAEPEMVAEDEEPKLSEKEEGDRLAQTAGELFDRLQHERETDEKFRNSTFMALMKKLRDREVVVAGNNMVESSTLHNDSDNATDGVEESLSI